MEDYRNAMVGIEANVTESRLDEAPQAYKDGAVVLDASKDLVDVIDHVKPLICVKG
jgi:tRNA-splicing ligase RtcB